MPLIRYENRDNGKRIVLTIITNPSDANNFFALALAGETVTLSAVETEHLLDWLYQQRDTIYALTQAKDTGTHDVCNTNVSHE